MAEMLGVIKNGTRFLIGGGGSSADKISYDNTNSGMTATNVQGAIDELNAEIAGQWTLLGTISDLSGTVNVPSGYNSLKIVVYWKYGAWYRTTFWADTQDEWAVTAINVDNTGNTASGVVVFDNTNRTIRIEGVRESATINVSVYGR
jgi:hypothetical protein